jgi:rod shape-determining protein MreC
MKSSRNQNWLDEVLIWLTSPIQKLVVWTFDGISNIWNGYIYLVGVKEENTELVRHNNDLKFKFERLIEVEEQNKRLRSLLHMRDKLMHGNFVVGHVIGMGTSPISRTMRIDVGTQDGVEMGNPVISGAGLVGRVQTVVAGYSEIELIVDSRSAVDVVIQKSRARGILRGKGEDEECSVDYVVRTAKVEVDDKVVTSGLGGAYPPGFAVGMVTMVSSPKVGNFRKVEVRPLVQFDILEEVLVVMNPSKKNVVDTEKDVLP